MNKRGFKERLINDYLGKGFSLLCAIGIIVITLSIIFFIGNKGIALFTENGVSVMDFLFSSNWSPNGNTQSFGALAFILGSIVVSIGAVLISAPVGVALGIFSNVISVKLGERIIKPSLEILVGIPSVVYGWVGVSVLVPKIKEIFGGTGFSLLAGVIVLSLMTLPTIAVLAIDAIKAVPKEHIEASYGLGATRWQTIKNVIVREAKGGILTGVVLGVARAFGEALAVQMVIGNVIKVPDGLTNSATTLTSILTMDMANTVSGTAWNNALWSLALILLIVSFSFILLIRKVEKRGGA
ncbi:phosphate ABC transporter permease subunit PstC [uncultured Clostridium sp.]|uniref:phosphate ABC transporter permease subunit PstC n=1 Tax=uncultured Clostridium sp. TaxID=59620 RepID=UPI002606C0A7|nr:phosphate ABC transporter permease subunit PstC [uncultured Clostridium sp.]